MRRIANTLPILLPFAAVVGVAVHADNRVARHQTEAERLRIEARHYCDELLHERAVADLIRRADLARDGNGEAIPPQNLPVPTWQ